MLRTNRIFIRKTMLTTTPPEPVWDIRLQQENKIDGCLKRHDMLFTCNSKAEAIKKAKELQTWIISIEGDLAVNIEIDITKA
ncbi:hypothetical protein KAR91_51675 [Candidatus Pacearchaeota archaeon]|nr:hypothetical protein [Candidatus Pacearchaeota archaeon]